MVYLIHFDRPFKHAKHYLGFTENAATLDARLNYHRKGSGSILLAAVTRAGIGYKVVRTWPEADRNYERKIKNNGHSAHYCPICKKQRKK